MPADDPEVPPDSSGSSTSSWQPQESCPDPLEPDFGPEPVELFEPFPEATAKEGRTREDEPGRGRPHAPWPQAPPPAQGGIFPGVACGGDACLLKPVANLFGKFGIRLVRGHEASLSRVAFSGIELMKAVRDFLDEEIALAEKAAGAGGAPRYEKIRVD